MTLNSNMNKEHSDDRVLVLSVKDGEKAKNSTGLVDPRLFKGENKLHAVMDNETCHWFMKYEMGGVPEALKGRYTSFPKLMEAAKYYFDGRGVEIKEVVE